MKTSNKIFIGAIVSIALLLLILKLNYRPDLQSNFLINISDKHSVVVINDKFISSDSLHFSTANTREESYIYYIKQGKGKKAPITNFISDTLFITFWKERGKGSLHLHLQGVKEVILNGNQEYVK